MDSDHARPFPKGQERYFGAVELMRMLRRRRLLIALTTLSITGAVGAVAYNLTPQFTAYSEVMIEQDDSHVVDTKRVVSTPTASQPLIETHVELLQSRKLAERLVEDLNLIDDPEFIPDAATERRLAIARRAARGLIAYLPSEWRELRPVKSVVKNGRKLFNRLQALLVPERPPVEPGRATVKSVVGQLAGRIEAEQVGKSHVIAVKVTSIEPQKAALLANRLTELYLDQLREAKSQANADAVRWLNARVDELREQLMESEREVASYLQEKRLPTGRHDDVTLAQMDRMNSQLAIARGDRAEAEARHRGLQALLKFGDGAEMGAKVASSPLLSDLRGQEAGLLRRIAELSATYGDRHPLLLKAKAELEELQGRFAQEVRRVADDLSNQVSVARAREAQLAASVNELREQSLRQGTVNVQLRDLERDAETNRQLYVSFLARLKELAEQKDISEAGAAIVSRAAVPNQPSFPQPERMLGIAVIGSLLIGLMLAFAAEGLDNVVRTSEQVERIVGTPVLAMVPEVKRGVGGAPLHHYMLGKPRSAFAEAVRNVQMELSLRSMGRPPKAIVVTSSLPGEGKTSLALCLAAAAASGGHATCLIDLDLHRPGLRRALRRGVGPDLIDYLAGSAELDAILVADERVANLATIVVRRPPSDPRALIGSPRMASLLDQLRERFALVVIDAPPVLPVRDAKVLAAFADAVVFAVRWGKTRDDAALAAVQTLTESASKPISAVITRVDLKKHAKRYFGDSIQYYTHYGKYYVN